MRCKTLFISSFKMTSLDGDVTSISSNESWYNNFAEKLLQENFLLTALEFHAELNEFGKNLPKLKEFFSDPGNFEHQAAKKSELFPSTNIPRSSSQATLDSLDFTRYSEDGERTTDDRVAVLEFELRKAKETIDALRANLTEAAESEKIKPTSPKSDLKTSQKSLKDQLSIKPHEQRALNFLINEYLLLNGYKLTSITFADENESQDFEDWNDVGLNSARPLQLLQLYREGLKGTGYSHYAEKKDFECQVILFDESQENLNINSLETEVDIKKFTKKLAENVELSDEVITSENKKLLRIDYKSSSPPDSEYFEIIGAVKSQDISDSRSDKSNGDWIKVENKKENVLHELLDRQTNNACRSYNEKEDNSSNVFDSTEMDIDALRNDKKAKDIQDDSGSESSTEVVKICEKTLSFNNKINENHKKFYDISKKETFCKNILDFPKTKREVPSNFQNEIFEHCGINFLILNDNILNDWFQNILLKGFSYDLLIDVLSESLPKIIPNIILNKREEVTPLLVASICFNSDSKVRDKLLNMLFNLKKKPQENERQVILTALYVIAQLKGSVIVENEILPQCWEQITHKYVERKLLVAESCFVLAPYVSETIRNSLIISICQQLLQDREESVRKASLKILVILVASITDQDKYSQVLEICLHILNDESPEVLNLVSQLLFPTLAQWSFALNKIQSDLYYKLLCKVKKDKSLCVVKIIEILLPYLVMSVANSEYVLRLSSVNLSSPTKRQEFCNLCSGLCDPELFFSGSVSEVLSKFDSCTSRLDFDSSKWPEMEWIMDVFIPNILEAGDNSWEESVVLKALMSALRYLCLGLGKSVTNYKIKPYLLEKLMECENAVVAGQDCRYSIIPLYLVGVLSAYPEDLQEMSNTLRRFICALPLCGVSLIPLQVTVEVLSQFQQWQILVLDAIWEGVVHQRPLVRSGSALLLNHIVLHIPESLLSAKVVPALVTLTSDPEASVRANAVPPLGMLMNVREKAIKDKVCMTLQTLLQDSISLGNHILISQLLKTLKLIYEICEHKFKEDVIVPQLSAIASLESSKKSKELVEILIDVFSTVTFSQTQISSQCATEVLLPGLRNLYSLCNQLNLSYAEYVNSMVKEVERQLAGSRGNSGKITSPSSEAKRLASVVSSHVVVEDVRSRVTKMFNSRPNTLQNMSGLFKKKP